MAVCHRTKANDYKQLNPMKHECVSGLGNFWKSRVRVRRDSAIKKLLKIFYFYFPYIFTIKILLKNTLLSLIHKTKKEEGKIGLFYPLRWEFRLFRLFRSPADTDRYGWYGLILAKSARFGANRAESARIRKKKKKKSQTWHQREGNRVGLGCGCGCGTRKFLKK